MTGIAKILKMVAVLIAAGYIGNWFLAEVRKVRAQGRPIYYAYLSIPGIIILIIFLLPVVYWLYTR